jgi:GNAT superfamily N-acetyltransferase
MTGKSDILEGVKFFPLTKDKWKDFELLFGEKGACGGCWCMWWKLTRSEFERHKGEANKRLMKHSVELDEMPGILAYYNDEPIGWCAVAPREKYPALERSRVLKRIDERPVWSVTCFYINKSYRKAGLTTAFLEFIIDYCRKKGAEIIEGYPIDPIKSSMPPVFAWTGFASSFRKAGFTEVARRSKTRPIMRYEL